MAEPRYRRRKEDRPEEIAEAAFDAFAANGYSAGSVLLKLVADDSHNGAGQGVKAEVVYSLSGSQFQNHHGGVVRLGDFIYAGHGNNNGLPTCLEFNTGRVVWKRRGPGATFLSRSRSVIPWWISTRSRPRSRRTGAW